MLLVFLNILVGMKLHAQAVRCQRRPRVANCRPEEKAGKGHGAEYNLPAQGRVARAGCRRSPAATGMWSLKEERMMPLVVAAAADPYLSKHIEKVLLKGSNWRYFNMVSLLPQEQFA